MEKYHIKKNSVQETLLIPLYARSKSTKLYPEIFKDPKSVELIQKIDYDFNKFEKDSGKLTQRFGFLECAMRQFDLTSEVKGYLTKYPDASVVNIGCGLDQTGENCDNGICKIYNLDFPDVIETRNQMEWYSLQQAYSIIFRKNSLTFSCQRWRRHFLKEFWYLMLQIKKHAD